MWMSIAVVLVTLLVLLFPLLPRQYIEKASQGPSSIQVLVLGDLGRSPRMQYHAQSLLKHGAQVQLIGYLGEGHDGQSREISLTETESELIDSLQDNARLTVVSISYSKRLQTSNKLLFLLLGPVKVILQVWNLWKVLGYQIQASKWMLVQNPPSIPTLLVTGVVCWLRGTRLVIDWHNFGYSILALKLGEKHPLVKIAFIYEFLCARFATAHLTVTDAMAKILRAKIDNSSAIVALHDRPAELFQPLSYHDRLAFLQKYPVLSEHFTALVDGEAKLLVSSTSWTPDEDFSVFLDALCKYAKKTREHPGLPELMVVITGKGPQKEHYLAKIEQLRQQDALEQITIYTDWLTFEDYALLLGAADLGVSLHTSSSGVDLPMKVVDMFGAGLPVLGWSKYAAWPELVTEGVNGRGFGSSTEMAEILWELFEPRSDWMPRLKAGALQESKRRWDDEWNLIGKRLFELER